MVHRCVSVSTKIYGLLEANNNTSDFRVRKLLEDLRRARPAPPDRHRLVTLQMLRGLLITF